MGNHENGQILKLGRLQIMEDLGRKVTSSKLSASKDFSLQNLR